MVMTWLVNSTNEEIGSNYMCYSTTKELWDNVNQMYSDLEFDEVRGWIIGRVPLPKISEVFAEKSNSGTVESSALNVVEGFANKAASFQRGLGERPRV
ncbi:hypothetical protein AAG906_017408 [Vitis piasezkii]